MPLNNLSAEEFLRPIQFSHVEKLSQENHIKHTNVYYHIMEPTVVTNH